MKFWERREPEQDVRNEETWLRMERLIRQEGRFLRLMEIVDLGDFTPTQGLQFVDHAYRFRGLLKQFSHGDKSIIVGVDEVAIPEIGFPRLDVMMVGAGFTREDFVEIRATYGLQESGFSDGFGQIPSHPTIESDPTIPR